MHPIRWKLALALSFCALAGHVVAGEDSPDAAAIQTTFAQYRSALLQGNGSKAADVVSAGTIAFYDGIRTHALNTPRAKLTELDFISKFIVLRMRHEFTRPRISDMTGRELLELGVNNGWISKSSVTNIDRLVNINVKTDQASAAMPMAPDVPAFHFLKESGQWKLDLVASFALANAAMKHEIAKTELTEDEFITRMLSILSSKEVDDRIFSPPPE